MCGLRVFGLFLLLICCLFWGFVVLLNSVDRRDSFVCYVLVWV